MLEYYSTVDLLTYAKILMSPTHDSIFEDVRHGAIFIYEVHEAWWEIIQRPTNIAASLPSISSVARLSESEFLTIGNSQAPGMAGVARVFTPKLGLVYALYNSIQSLTHHNHGYILCPSFDASYFNDHHFGCG